MSCRANFPMNPIIAPKHRNCRQSMVSDIIDFYLARYWETVPRGSGQVIALQDSFEPAEQPNDARGLLELFGNIVLIYPWTLSGRPSISRFGNFGWGETANAYDNLGGAGALVAWALTAWSPWKGRLSALKFRFQFKRRVKWCLGTETINTWTS